MFCLVFACLLVVLAKPAKEGGVQERGPKVATIHETKISGLFTQRTEENSALSSLRVVRGIKGARA